ncbi:hypothetical protein E4T56_gene4822 [Termitomyces sp. T112]|nr:hypothetical protein E4T56_gene4822 [Termitomyces sp. T112]KAH0587335.1 hypothetical protein H2248_006135 [Termitomyces sp. 'cryptogamus']
MIIKRLAIRRGPWSSLQGTALQRRTYSENVTPKPRSAHAQWYSDTVPAMIPIFLLGSAVYLGLQLTQQTLSHEKFVQEASARVKALEAEVDALQENRTGTPVGTLESKKSSRWW